MKYLPYGRQFIHFDDIKEVVRVLKSDWITQGPKVQEFENSLAKYCGAKYAVVVSSATAALHLACFVTRLKKGDEAITSPITFLATSNSILYTGAKPIFADIDYDSINIDPQEIERKITQKTKAILPVHFAGLPCDMEKIYGIAKRNKLTIIEDAAHALGAKYRIGNKWFKVGSCQHSDMAIFSFHPVKHITTGEGGAITTNNKKFYEKLRVLRNHGVYRDRIITKNRPWYYEMRELGFNYRITDFQCALGINQLKRIKNFIERRRNIAKKYDATFRHFGDIQITKENKNQFNCYHLYPIKVKNETTRLNLFRYLRKEGILCQVHYIPVYWQPYYQRLGYKRGICPIAEDFYHRVISIPIYFSMTEEDINLVIQKILNFFKK